jgi:hypothetical protein
MEKHSQTLQKSGWFSLSAKRYIHSSDCYLRDCDAICDISIYDPKDSLFKPHYILTDAYRIPFVKDGALWVLPNQLFTVKKPLYVVHMPFSSEYIDLQKTDQLDPITIAWTSIKLPTSERKPKTNFFGVRYGTKEVLYGNGLVGVREILTNGGIGLAEWDDAKDEGNPSKCTTVLMGAGKDSVSKSSSE